MSSPSRPDLIAPPFGVELALAGQRYDISHFGHPARILDEETLSEEGRPSYHAEIDRLALNALRAGTTWMTTPTFHARRIFQGDPQSGHPPDPVLFKEVIRAHYERMAQLSHPFRRQVKRILVTLGPTSTDCYHADPVPRDFAELLAYYRELIVAVKDSLQGKDYTLLLETICTQRELIAAIQAVDEVGVPAFVSGVVDSKGILDDGVPFGAAAAAGFNTIQRSTKHLQGLGVNCCPDSGLDAAKQSFYRSHSDLAPILRVAYINGTNTPAKRLDAGMELRGAVFREDGFIQRTADFARAAHRHELEACGGCCGYTAGDYHIFRENNIGAPLIQAPTPDQVRLVEQSRLSA